MNGKCATEVMHGQVLPSRRSRILFLCVHGVRVGVSAWVCECHVLLYTFDAQCVWHVCVYWSTHTRVSA